MRKELLDLFRDRRSLISMLAVPLLVFPLLISGMTRLMPKLQQRAEEDLQSMGIAARVSNPAAREAIEKLGLKIVEADDLKTAVQKKSVAAAVEEVEEMPLRFLIYVDESAPVSSTGGERIREALTAFRDAKVRESLRRSGIDGGVLTPFAITRTNVAGERKMAGALWGSMLGYLLLLLMFTGGMYPIMDMTAGEKERKTMEALLVAPVERREIVLGKTLTAIVSILLTSALTLLSLVISFKSSGAAGGSEDARRMQAVMGTITLDSTVAACWR